MDPENNYKIITKAHCSNRYGLSIQLLEYYRNELIEIILSSKITIIILRI